MRRTERLGRYHLAERIAYGGMAEIFRGFTFSEDGNRKDIAIKKLLPHFTEDNQFVDMLADEFKLVSHLRHPNIAEVFELADVDGALFIAMEYVDGKDLRTVNDRARNSKTRFHYDDIAYIMARALDGLHHAHVAKDKDGHPLQIVHRDFSPSNVLISYDGWVKICDFGIAKATHSRIQTKTGIIKGKVKYMSPEQAFGKRLDWRSDVFSAGSVLYELVTGKAPFHASSEIDLIFAVRDASPALVLEANPAVPPALASIIEKSMSRSRSGRYQSAMDFRDALLQFLKVYNPLYRRSHLARIMKRLCADDIERELRLMEEVVVDLSAKEDWGRNLIADALGPDATYTKFNPNAQSGAPINETDRLHRAQTELHDMELAHHDMHEPQRQEDSAVPAEYVGRKTVPHDPGST